MAEGKLVANFKEIMQIGITFLLTVFAWIFFRADNLSHAFSYISRIFNSTNVYGFEVFPYRIIGFIIFFIIIEWFGKEGKYALEKIDILPKIARFSIYSVLIFAILVYSGEQQEFIYFQF